MTDQEIKQYRYQLRTEQLSEDKQKELAEIVSECENLLMSVCQDVHDKKMFDDFRYAIEGVVDTLERNRLDYLREPEEMED